MPCHYCEVETDTSECPRCDQPTCEDCFEPMTQFNAGWELFCLECRNQLDRERHDEAVRESKQKAEADAKKDAAAMRRRVKYRSPEAKTKRQEAKQEKMRRQQEIMEDVDKRVSEFMKQFISGGLS